MDIGKKYTTFKIAKIFKIKYGRLKEWINGDYITPSEKADGQGTKSFFNLYDVYMVKFFIYLLERGFSRQEASDRIKNISSGQYLKTLPKAKIKSPGDRLYNAKVKYYKDVISANYLIIYRHGSKKIMDAITAKNRKAIIKSIGREILIDDANKDSNIKWDDILIVNFKKIRSEVDKALA